MLDIYGDIFRTKGVTVQGCRKMNGEEILIVTSDHPKQYIEIPIMNVTAASEDLWGRIGSERHTKNTRSVG